VIVAGAGWAGSDVAGARAAAAMVGWGRA